MNSLTIFPIAERIFVMKSPFLDDQLPEVQKYFIDVLHDQVQVYNVEDEEAFSVEQELPHVTTFPLQAGCPPALESISSLLVNVESLLTSKHDTSVFFHCKNGKAKSCFLAACLVLHCGIRSNAKDAVDLIHTMRGEQVLRVPSLVRYVHYYERILRMDRVPCQSFSLSLLRINTIPRFTSSIIHAGCTPTIGIYQLAKGPQGRWYYCKLAQLVSHHDFVEGINSTMEFSFDRQPLTLRGDIGICAFHGNEKMFQFFFHTAFVENSFLFFDKGVIDMASEDTQHRLFSKDFSVEMVFRRVSDNPKHSQRFETEKLRFEKEDLENHLETKYEL